jgi:phage terminase large subunit-like protein
MNTYNIQSHLRAWQKHCTAIQNSTAISLTETTEEQQIRIDRARKDYRFFVEYYFPHYATAKVPDFHVELARMVKSKKNIKAIVRWGRGLAKSVVCDIMIPIWLWINGEPVYIVIIGNNEEKADILLNDLMAEFANNQRLRHDFGNQVQPGKWATGSFSCRERFIAKAIGMGQDARGLREGAQRPNYIVADDLEDKDTIRNPRIQDEIVQWIERAIIPAMDGPIRRYLHVNNHFATRTIQELLRQRHPEWVVHQVDACPGADRKPIWSDKYPANYYLDLEKEIGTLALEAEYNNKPFIEGKVFTPDLIQWATPPRIDSFEIIIGRWDPAYSGKNDYNAIRVWALKEHKFWLLASFVRQCKMNDAIAWMYEYQKSLPEGVIVHWRVESQFWNDPLREAIKEVEKYYGYPLNLTITESPKGKKLDRLLSMHPYYQNGRIYYNAKEKANNDMQVGLAQLFGIEPGYRTHDDAPDADEQAISDLVKMDRVMSFEPKLGYRKAKYGW